MEKQFWNREATDKSLGLLRRMSREVDFVLIGGWAVYMYVKAQKSQDIDIFIGYDSLDYFRKAGIEEYEGSRIRYSKIDGVVVDLFIEEYVDRDMPFPSREVFGNYERIENIMVVDRNLLLLLKLWGYFSADEVKHRKDVIDVVSLLFYGGLDLGAVEGYIRKYNISRRKGADAMLEYLDVGATMHEYITGSAAEYERLRKEYKNRIKETMG